MSTTRHGPTTSVLTFLVLIAALGATVAADYFGEPPNYLVALLGAASGAFFAAISTDRQRKDADTANTANEARATATRAEAKVDTIADATAGHDPAMDEKIRVINTPEDDDTKGGSS